MTVKFTKVETWPRVIFLYF